jgi:hypothetical protein
MIDKREMCSGPILGCLALLLALAQGDCPAATQPIQQGLSFPRSFRNEAEARQQHCTQVRLKSRDSVSCVVQKFWDHALMLAIYDKNTKGRFLKTTEFCVPSWYGMAKLRYVNLLGDGRNFLDITFEGNTGTGTLQMIQMYIGWNGTAFVPAYAETIDYTIGALGFKRRLTVRTIVRNHSSANVSMHLQFRYSEGQESDAEPTSLWRSTSEWRNILRWNSSTFKFEEDEAPPQDTDQGLFRPDWIRRNISRTRAALGGISVHELCDSYFEKSGIMNIFEASQPEDTP